MSRLPKALVISVNQLTLGHDRVHCFQWNSLRDLPSIDDFDLVVLDTTELSSGYMIDAVGFCNAFTPVAFWRVVEPGGKVIVVGDPSFAFRHGGGTQGVTKWTGFRFQFEKSSGDQISVLKDSGDNRSDQFLSGLRKYSWLMVDSPKHKHIPLTTGGKEFNFSLTTLAENRAGLPIAAKISPVLHRGTEFQYEAWDRGLWLLPEYQGPDGDGVSVILRDFFGIHAKTREPDWVSCVYMPGESEIREGVGALKEEIKQKEVEVKEQEEELRLLRKPVALLYETGLPLEKIVRKALERLGGIVTTSPDTSSHDGWVSIDIGGQEHHFVLEVKGYEADSVKEEGLKQLSTWVAEAIDQQELNPKPVLVVNSSRLKPLDQRNEVFSDSFLKKANMWDVAVLPSRTLFCVLLEVLEEKLEPSTFWKALLQCKGLFSLENLPTS